MQEWEIKGHCVEFDEETHTYIVDGLIVPSVTQIIRWHTGDKYAMVDRDVLEAAAKKGTELHEAIQRLCELGEMSDLKEVRNFIFLRDRYGFVPVENEMPILLFMGRVPVAAGRIDLTFYMAGQFAIADIKRTASLDREYLNMQLNLYRLGLGQSYGIWADKLYAIHLRDDVRKLVPFQTDADFAFELLTTYIEGVKE